MTIRLHSFGASGADWSRITGVMPDWRSAYCSTMLCIEYQKGTATCLPPSPAKSVMSVCSPTTTPEPLVCAQASTFTGKLLL